VIKVQLGQPVQLVPRVLLAKLGLWVPMALPGQLELLACKGSLESKA
jgi:hypothetical protein